MRTVISGPYGSACDQHGAPGQIRCSATGGPVDQPGTLLCGRDGVVGMVHQCLDRPVKGPARLLPIVVTAGRHGSGKTFFVEDLHRQLKPVLPCALLYLEHAADSTPGDIAAALAFQLNSHVRQFGRIAFPRLMLGLLGIRLNIDRHSRQKARRKLERELDRSEVLAAAARLVDEVGQKFVDATNSPVVQSGEMGVQFLFSEALPRLGRLRFQVPLAWYASFLNCGNGKDALIELNQAASAAAGTDPAGKDQALVDKTLCAAFLADLRADYDRFSVFHGKRTVNCLALLDNADTLAGARFLKLLAGQRYPGPSEPDPLLIVATVGNGPERRLPAGQPAAGPMPGYPAWARSFSPDKPASWWCPIALTDLSPAGTRLLVRSKVLGSPERDALFLHAVTGGHPATTSLLAEQMGLLSDQARANPALRLRGLLDLPVDGAGGERVVVADRALELLLGKDASDADDPLLADMVTCAAVTNLKVDACQAALGADADVSAIVDMLSSFARTMPVQAGPGRPRYAGWPHPLLRRLLLRLLAQRGEAANGWKAVHRRLARYFCENGDVTASLYHRLALGQLAAAATGLDQYLDRLGAGPFCEMLHAVAAAPIPLRVTAPAVKFVDERVHGLGPLSHRRKTVASLLAACWLYQDWLSDPGRTLARFIAVQFEHLMFFDVPDRDVFLAESERYQDDVSEWE